VTRFGFFRDDRGGLVALGVEMKCPHCDSQHVFLSRRGNANLRWPFRLFVVAVRCYVCQSRFFRLHPFWGRQTVRKPPAEVGFY
jgi:hypothetical protein